MGKKFTVILGNIDGMDITIQSDDFDKLVNLSNRLTNKEPQLDGRPIDIRTKDD